MPTSKEFGFPEMEQVFNRLAINPEVQRYSARRTVFPDETSISAVMYPNHGFETLDIFSVKVAKGRLRVVEFQMDVNGLAFIQTYRMDITIGNETIPGFDRAIFSTNYHNVREESQEAFRRSSKPLVLWLKKIVDQGQYCPPPISTRPSIYDETQPGTDMVSFESD